MYRKCYLIVRGMRRATGNHSVKLLQERLRLFEYDAALDVYYMVVTDALCSEEADRVKG